MQINFHLNFARDANLRADSLQNTLGKTGKAVALRVSADRAAFYGCRILSYQDTLLDDAGRHYYRNCYIEGAIDFIFGNASSIFEVSSKISTTHAILYFDKLDLFIHLLST